MNLRRLYITIALIFTLLSVTACGTLRFKAEGTVESETPPTTVSTPQPSLGGQPEVERTPDLGLPPDPERILLETID